MENTTQQDGHLLFEQINELVNNEKLTPKERIPKYRTVLEDLFQLLTQDAPTHLTGLFAKTTYYFREYEPSEQVINHVHELRKFGNQVVHNSSLIPTAKDDLRCLYYLCESIASLSKVSVPEGLKVLYKNDEASFSKFTTKKKVWNNEKYEFRAVVEHVYIPDNDGVGKFPCIVYCNTEEYGELQLKLWNNKNENDFGTDFREFAYLLQPYRTIYVTEVIKYDDKEDEFFASRESLLTLEPDYLVDAKELAECVQSENDTPLLYLLNRFNKGEITDRVIVGNIVGSMLDDLVIEGDKYEYKNTFKKAMQSNSFGMLCLSNENGHYNNQSIKQIYLEAQGHERTLKHTLEQFSGKNCIVEPTFISNKFGIQGRLDLLLVDKEKPQRKDIIELKSSRSFPSVGRVLFGNHQAQTLCYDLLLQSTYPDRIGNNHILYSSASIEEKPLRFVSGSHYMEKQAILMLRNRIVANELSLAEGDENPILQLLKAELNLPAFIKPQHDAFFKSVSVLDEPLKSYFFEYLQFIFQELKTAKIGQNNDLTTNYGFARTWLSEKNEKLDNQDALVYLKVDKVSEQLHVILSYSKDIFQQSHAFRLGDFCILYPTPDPENLDPLHTQILKCYITEISDAKLTVSLINKQIHKDYFDQKTYWALEPDFRDTGYKQMLRSLFMLLQADKKSQRLVLGLDRPMFDEVESLADTTSLNTVQKEIVAKALSAKDYYLIQGPPGTGKTSNVLCELVMRRARSGLNVMVLAFTNKAVDLIGEKLEKKGVSVIRLGKSAKAFSWSVLSKQNSLDKLYDRVADEKVFLATQASFLSSLDLLKIKEFDTLIVDEASQLLEPHLVGIIPFFKRFILIGDENQLPPVVIQEDRPLKNADILQKLALTNPKHSLFDRLKRNAIAKKWDDCYGMLTIHYRMHEAIADFPNRRFYSGKLVAGFMEQKTVWPSANLNYSDHLWAKILRSNRLLFIPSARASTKKSNKEEANMIKEILMQLESAYGDRFDQANTVGVITPFRTQIATIRQEIGDKFKDITVDTIERYQGSERDIIIFSFAINNTGQLLSIQSLSDTGVDRKLNVAITRAKQQLILLGTEPYLEKSPVISELLEMIKTRGGYHLNPAKEKSIPADLF
ncbi:AAA domain-containing protein [Phaeodactylibacter xiamenensis]|uniref:AAA domain-containing protein n=1 Tax=Phaeodactylibacter xiamenensis TaxID=1524460 RepID=UPI0024A937D3|nr:AAA domain-containing protein [Phaeodactylibacter xiamenensis]